MGTIFTLKNFPKIKYIYMKKLFMSLMILALISVSFVSCDDNVDINEPQMADLSFNLENLNLTNKFENTKNTAQKQSFYKSSDDQVEIPYPECTELQPSYVEATIDGTMYPIEFTSLTGANGMLNTTEVVQLLSGTYTMTEFIVFAADGTPIYSAPDEGPDAPEGLITMPLTLDLAPFTKTPINVDVVCWHEFSFQPLAWGWFNLEYHQIKTLTFFGDVCSKFYSEFGATEYDFVASITVDIFKDGVLVASVTNASSNPFVGIAGEPLTIEYVDDLQLDNENFDFTVTLHTPTGDITLVEHESFIDGVYSSDDGLGGFGGDDGVWNFNVGNCGNSADEGDFPAYLPLPETLVSFTLTGEVNQQDGKFSLNIGDHAQTTIANFPLISGDHVGWCVDYDTAIYYNVQYEARVWSLLNILDIPNETRLNRVKVKAGVLHWVINHLDALAAEGFVANDIQNLIWWLVSAEGDASAAVKARALTIPSYNPKVGDYALVLFDPYIQNDDTRVQAFGVRIDP